ncbi:MAG: DUF4856 domain-containing protein [Saprospiraceae bacterium]
MNNSAFQFLAVLTIFSFTIISCGKDNENVLNDKDIPTTYSFENVSYAGQTARLDMLQAMTSYMKTANTVDVQVSASKLRDMFANENNPFENADLNTATKQIRNKIFESHIPKFETYMDALAELSGNTNDASAGTAGVATSGSKSYLLNANGVEYTQLIEKGLMGALNYYQVCEKYTRDEKIGNDIDNTEVTEGKGTKMEHHWDEAFGYVGANVEMDGEGYRYHGKYSGKGEELLKTRTNLFQSFLAGRAAISAKDMVRKDDEAKKVRKYMELTTVTTAIHYLNGGKTNFADYAKRCHGLSEAYAFVGSLKYNGDSKISSADLDVVLSNMENIEGNPDFANITITDLNNTINALSAVYSLDDIKDSL